MTAGARSILIVMLVVSAVACESGASRASPREADMRVATASVDPSVLVGGTWHRLESSPDVDARLARNCGSVPSGLGISRAKLVRFARSETYNGVSDRRGDEEGGDVRIGVLVFRSAAAAARAARVSSAGFRRCLVRMTNHYLDHRGASYPTVEHATGRSFRLVRRSVSIGDGGVLIEGGFDEAVLGGGDNCHNVDLLVARSGATVVTVVVAANGQGLAPDGQISLARRISRGLIARVRLR